MNTAPIFYSQLQRTLAEKLPSRGRPDEFRRLIETFASKGLFKREELEWSGALEWLEEQPEERKITRDELLTKIQAFEIQVHEVVLGRMSDVALRELQNEKELITDQIKELVAHDDYLNDLQSQLRQLNIAISITSDLEERREVQDQRDYVEYMWFTECNDRFKSHYVRLEEIENQLNAGPTSTKYAHYQLPYGMNYRELLIKLPPAGPIPFHLWQRYRSTWGDKSGSKEEYERLVATGTLYKGQSFFQSKHWEGHQNVLVHVRFSERQLDSGDHVLHVEEIQSDWHQEGRKAGYFHESLPDLQRSVIQARKDLQRIIQTHGTHKKLLTSFREQCDATHPVIEVEDRKGNLIYRGTDRLKGHHLQLESGGNLKHTGEMESPFTAAERAACQNSLSLVSRAENRLRDAERAYSDELWKKQHLTQPPNAPFKQNWALLAMKRLLRWAAEHDFDKVTWTQGKDQADRYNLSKCIDRVEYESIYSEDTGEPNGLYDLEAFGKDGAKLISLEEVGLDVIANHIGRELSKKIEADAGEPANHSPYREWRVLSGFDLHVGDEGMRGFYDQILPSEVKRYVKKWNAQVKQIPLEQGNRFIVEDENNCTIGMFSTHEEALTFLRSGRGQSITGPVPGAPVLPREHPTVWAVDVTPSMRASVLRGQPLFSLAGEFLGTSVTADDLRLYLHTRLKDLLSPKVYQSIEVVATAAELPIEVLAQGGVSAAGAYDPVTRRAYLVAERVKNLPEAMDTVVRHELRHRSLDDYIEVLAAKHGGDVAWAARQVQERLDGIYLARKAEIEGLAPSRQDQLAGLSADARRRLLTEEWLCENAGRLGNERWLDGLVAALRDLCRAIGVKLRMNPAEIRVFERNLDESLTSRPGQQLVWINDDEESYFLRA